LVPELPLNRPPRMPRNPPLKPRSWAEAGTHCPKRTTATPKASNELLDIGTLPGDLGPLIGTSTRKTCVGRYSTPPAAGRNILLPARMRLEAFKPVPLRSRWPGWHGTAGTATCHGFRPIDRRRSGRQVEETEAIRSNLPQPELSAARRCGGVRQEADRQTCRQFQGSTAEMQSGSSGRLKAIFCAQNYTAHAAATHRSKSAGGRFRPNLRLNLRERCSAYQRRRAVLSL
jgi:hypothetical protein